LCGPAAGGCGHLRLVVYWVPRSVRECSSKQSRPRPIPGVHEHSRTHLDLVAAIQRKYLYLLFFFVFEDMETM
jgi:hypothetical protein